MKISYIYPRKTSVKAILTARFTYKYNQYNLSTGVKIALEFWDLKSKKVKSSYPAQSRAFDDKIAPFEKAIHDAIYFYEENFVTPTKEALKERIEFNLAGGVVKNKEVDGSLLGYYQLFVDWKKENYDRNTWKNNTSVQIALQDFQNDSNTIFKFEHINKVWYDNFTSFLLNRKNNNSNAKTSDGCENSTINKYMGSVVSFMNWAADRDYHNTVGFLRWKRLPTIDKSFPVISFMELKMLECAKDLTDAHKRIRDVFLFLCYTGQRWQTYAGFDVNDIVDGVWTPRHQKTKVIACIDMNHSYCNGALKILEKYDYKLPKISAPIFNEEIKEICRLVGIDSIWKDEYIRGRKLSANIGPKHQFISSHCGRRTLVTNINLLGVPEAIGRNISGHKTSRMFIKYNNNVAKDVTMALERSSQTFDEIWDAQKISEN